MKSRRLIVTLAVALGCVPLTFHGRVQADARGSRSLTAIVGPLSLTRDTTGTGRAAPGARRGVVPAAPTLGEVEAATNLAARLGYETPALTLPLVVRDDDVAQPASIGVPILVGRTNRFVQQLVSAKTLDLGALKPGQGLIAVVAAPLGGGVGLIVVGGDDEGTVNAGVELAARLPRVWGMSGIALPGVEDQAIRHLRAHGVQAREAGVSSIIVDSDRRGVARVTLRLVVAEADGARAAKVLEDLELAHRRGQEPRTLNFTNVAATAIDVVAGANVFARVEVTRTGLNQRTLTPPIDPDELAPDSPGDRGRPTDAGAAGAPARTFDLFNALSIDGWYGDAYADLIPDRTDTTIILGGAADSLPAAHIAARLGLETTGITLPLTRVADKVRTPEREPSPILVGRSNTLVERLVKIGKARFDDLQPGEGAVQIVPKELRNLRPTAVSGADAAGHTGA